MDVILAGQWFRIPGVPAIRWVLKIADNDWLGIVPGMVDGPDEDDDDIDESIEYGWVTSQELVSAARDAVTTASGMPWWSAQRLVVLALEDVEMAGAMVLAGVRADRVSLGGFCAAVYRLLLENQDRKGRAELDGRLSAVPRGVEASDLYDPQRAAAQFEAAFSNQSRGH